MGAYAQRPIGWLMTSTVTDGDRCGLDEIVDLKLGDWEPPKPMPRQLLRADGSARVYEVARAEDCRRLVERYPTSAAVDAPMGPCISVDWSAARSEWDAVHLSLAGAPRKLCRFRSGGRGDLPVVVGYRADALAE